MRVLLEAIPLVSKVVILRSTSSTNDDARRLAARGAPTGTVVLAGSQEAGRGSRGRSWFAAPGAGVYLSVLLRPDGGPVALTRWTIAASVAVAEACRAICGPGFVVKWPNDVLHEGGKVAGILAEGRTSGAGVADLVLGIGVNVGHRADDFPADLRGSASSLRLALGGKTPPDRETVAASLLERLDGVASSLADGRWLEIASRWSRLAPSARGSRVRIRAGPAEPAREGRTHGLDSDGALRVERNDGTMVVVRHGDSVEWMEDGPCC